MRILYGIIISLLCAFTAYSQDVKQTSLETKDFQNWMSKLADNTRLCLISIPGSHDSGACRNGGILLQTQDIDIASQLAEGIRCFDIRLQAMEDGKLGVYHGPAFQDIYWEENVLADFIRFLQKNPSETLIVSLKKENGKISDYARSLSSTLEKPEYQSYFIQDFRPDITLGECRGKILFMHRDHAMKNYPGVECLGSVWGDNATFNMSMRDNDGTEGRAIVEDEYLYPSDEKASYKTQVCIDNINKRASEPANSDLWAITFVSATAVPVSGPIHFAEKVNEPVAKHIRRLGKSSCGIVLIDFAGSAKGKMVTKALIQSNM
ncbi:phosphatidylinositol-specific phospholipase C [Parabacteroides chinchillae]